MSTSKAGSPEGSDTLLTPHIKSGLFRQQNFSSRLLEIEKDAHEMQKKLKHEMLFAKFQKQEKDRKTAERVKST